MHNEIKCIGGFRERGKRMRPLRIIGLPIIIKAVTFSSCCILIISIYLIRTGSSRLHIIWHCYQSLFCFLIVCIILFHIKTQLPTDCIFPFKFYYKNNFKTRLNPRNTPYWNYITLWRHQIYYMHKEPEQLENTINTRQRKRKWN